MEKTILKSIVLLLFSIQLNAQWISFEAAMGPGSAKTQKDYEDFQSDYTYGRVEGMDTTYLRNRSYGRRQFHRQVSRYSQLNVAAKINIPLRERWTLSAGVGLSSAFFEYQDVNEIVDYTSVIDTLTGIGLTSNVPIIKVGGGGGTSSFGRTEDGAVCDSLVIDELAFVPSMNTKNSLGSLYIPLDLSYDLVPDILFLKVGANINFSLLQEQKYSEEYRRKHDFFSTDSLTVCQDVYRTVFSDNTDLLANVSVAGLVRLEANIYKYMNAFIAVSQTINSLTDPAFDSDDPMFSIAFEYRPTVFQIGATFDLAFGERGKRRKTNYLIKTNQDDN